MKLLHQIGLFRIGPLALLLAVSCHKPADERWPAASDFVGKAWRLETIRPVRPTDLTGDGRPDDDVLALLDACERDDRLTFGTNGRFHTDRGTNRCSPNEAVDAPGGTYRFFAKTRALSLTDWSAPGKDHVWEVLETAAHRLRVRTVFELPDRPPLTVELLFTTN